MATRDTPSPPPLGPKPKVLVGQLRILLEAIEEDSTMYNARNNDMITIMNIDKWVELADKLNEFPNGAQISVGSWKYVLRYWSVNTKNKRNHEKRMLTRARNSSLTDEEAEELASIEKRFYRFIKREEARGILDVTHQDIDTQDLDQDLGEETKTDGENIPESVKFIVEMFNVFSNENEENTKPAGKMRALVVRRSASQGLPGKPKKMKLVFDSISGDRAVPHRVVIENDQNIHKMHLVSRELEEHISTIQNRIHMIKDLWKHRCGDN